MRLPPCCGEGLGALACVSLARSLGSRLRRTRQAMALKAGVAGFGTGILECFALKQVRCRKLTKVGLLLGRGVLRFRGRNLEGLEAAGSILPVLEECQGCYLVGHLMHEDSFVKSCASVIDFVRGMGSSFATSTWHADLCKTQLFLTPEARPTN